MGFFNRSKSPEKKPSAAPPSSSDTSSGHGDNEKEDLHHHSQQHQQQQPKEDLHFRICLVGDSQSGKTSFRQCTTQILSTKPDVLPTPASSTHQYFSKIKGGGKLFLDVVDYGQSGEREILLLRHASVSSIFVVFVNLSFVKQRVDKSIFSGRTDTVVMHNTFKESLRKWVTLCYLANPHSCSLMVVGTHKDFLTYQDELAMQAVLKELRTQVTQICDKLPTEYAKIERLKEQDIDVEKLDQVQKQQQKQKQEGAMASSNNSSKSNNNNNNTAAAGAVVVALSRRTREKKPVQPPRCFGCFAVSCVDHSCVSENREGPKNIKNLWQFLCELSPKLADRTQLSFADTQLRNALNVLRHERGLRCITLHDLFLYSLTQGIVKKVMSQALKRKRNVGDISLSLVRRANTKISVAMIDLGSTSRLLASLDYLRRRLVTLSQMQQHGSGGEDAMGMSASSMSTGNLSASARNLFSSSASAAADQKTPTMTSLSSTTLLSSSTTANNATSINSSSTGNSHADPAFLSATTEQTLLETEGKSSSKDAVTATLYPNVEEAIRAIPFDKREEIVTHGAMTFETMATLAGVLLAGKTVTLEEKFFLFWQMTTCTGYFIPCMSLLPVMDCLLENSGSFSSLNKPNQAEEDKMLFSLNSTVNTSSGNNVIDPLNSTSASSASSAASSGLVGNSSAATATAHNLIKKHHTASYFLFSIGGAHHYHRAVPREALDQLCDLDTICEKYHFALRRVVFSPDLSHFSKHHLFSLFIGRLVNIASLVLLCPSHLFECGAWFRDKSSSSSQCRLLVNTESSGGVISFRFLSSADAPVRVHAAFMIEVTQAAKAVFADLELHRVAKWEVPSSADNNNNNNKKNRYFLSSPKSKFASGTEDLSRLDLAFGNF